MKLIKKAVKEYYGRRCPDFEPECIVCQAWAEYDSAKRRQRKERKEYEMSAYEANNEETGKWIVLNYFPHNPVDVYGFFDSEEEARAYADKNRMAENGNAYDVKQVMNAHYVEMPDPVRDGWVGADGRP